MDNLSNGREQKVRESVARQPLLKLYGVEVVTVGQGYVELATFPQPFMLRTSGIVHGGIMAALADSAGGYAVASMEEDPPSLLTIEFKINFLATAKGEQLLAAGRVLKHGRTISVAQADLFSVTPQDKKLVATALVTMIKPNEHGNSIR